MYEELVLEKKRILLKYCVLMVRIKKFIGFFKSSYSWQHKTQLQFRSGIWIAIKWIMEFLLGQLPTYQCTNLDGCLWGCDCINIYNSLLSIVLLSSLRFYLVIASRIKMISNGKSPPCSYAWLGFSLKFLLKDICGAMVICIYENKKY